MGDNKNRHITDKEFQIRRVVVSVLGADIARRRLKCERDVLTVIDKIFSNVFFVNMKEYYLALKAVKGLCACGKPQLV